MTFIPKANLAYFGQTPTLDNPNGTFKADGKTHAYTLRLKTNREQSRKLVEQAKLDGITNQLPTAPRDLNTFKDRLNAIRQRMAGLVPHGWIPSLNRPNPTASGGSIEPRQAYVTREKVAFPGTTKVLNARVTELFETELQEGNTLSEAKKIGTVVSYELGDTFMLHRKKDAEAHGDNDGQPDTASDANTGRILVISAHGADPTEETEGGNRKTRRTRLPDDIAFSYGVPHGFDSGSSRAGRLESEFHALAKDQPPFAGITKIGKNVELAVLPRTVRLDEFMNAEGGLGNAEAAAKRLFRLAAGTSKGGRVADNLMTKFDGVRHGEQLKGGIPPLVYTRAGDTYSQLSFEALNDNKVDILTIRAGKRPHKSDLVRILDEVGIRSQYMNIYDPSCRVALPHEPGKETPLWDPALDNIAYDENQPVMLKRTKKPGSGTEVKVVDTNDEDFRKWAAQKYTATSQPQGRVIAEGSGRQSTQQTGQEPPPIEIPLD
jgi:hypothetical protein